MTPTDYKKHAAGLLAAMALAMMAGAVQSCDYDEEMTLCQVSVRLVYPNGSIDPYAGARVEMKDSRSSVFVDSTDATGTARFQLPPGLYEATSNSQYVDSVTGTWWRYIFNGVRSMIVISPDSSNQVEMPLKMSRKRIVH